MSTGVGMSSCCLSGKVHDGSPKGHYEEIAGLDTYVSEPEGGSKAKSIVFISDIFGYRLPNIQLLADNYAAAGFYVYIPDFHSGDSLPLSFLQDAEPPLATRQNLTLIEKGLKTANVGVTLGPWLIKHREAVAKPLMEGFFNTLRYTPGTNKVGTIGFCWGGRYAMLMAHSAESSDGEGAKGPWCDAAVACHPSLVAVPGDFEPIVKPVSLAVGSEDSLLSMDQVEKIKEVLEKKKGDVESEVVVFEDQVHGFALRSDWSSDKDREAMDKAEKQGIAWFEKYLGGEKV